MGGSGGESPREKFGRFEPIFEVLRLKKVFHHKENMDKFPPVDLVEKHFLRRNYFGENFPHSKIRGENFPKIWGEKHCQLVQLCLSWSYLRVIDSSIVKIRPTPPGISNKNRRATAISTSILF